jgi:hypothetical protein
MASRWRSAGALAAAVLEQGARARAGPAFRRPLVQQVAQALRLLRQFSVRLFALRNAQQRQPARRLPPLGQSMRLPAPAHSFLQRPWLHAVRAALKAARQQLGVARQRLEAVVEVLGR